MRAHCWIDEAASRTLWREAGRWRLRETGGALLGWRDGNDAVVARVLGPGPNASHGFRSFEPDGEWQQEQGEEIYFASGRTIAYIGEWHTHPFSAPLPSSQDRLTAAKIAADSCYRAPKPLSAIIGCSWRPFRSVDPDLTLVVYMWIEDTFRKMRVQRCVLGVPLEAMA